MIQRLVEWEVLRKANGIQCIQKSQRMEGLQKNSKDHKKLFFSNKIQEIMSKNCRL